MNSEKSPVRNWKLLKSAVEYLSTKRKKRSLIESPPRCHFCLSHAVFDLPGVTDISSARSVVRDVRRAEGYRDIGVCIPLRLLDVTSLNDGDGFFPTPHAG
jgi:hypothetical protein